MIPTQDIGAAAIGLGIVIGSVWSGWQSVLAKREAKQAKTNSHPISNGWGTALREDMAAVRVSVARLEESALLNERRQGQQDDRLQRVEDGQAHQSEVLSKLSDRVVLMERAPLVSITTNTTEATA